MHRPNHLLDHLLDPKYQDQLGRVIASSEPDPERLCLIYTKTLGDWNTVARYIAGSPRWPVTWCPDANVAFLPSTDAVWDALRVSALGSPTGSTLITGAVEAEMKEWLDDPWLLQNRAKDISVALANETWIRKYNLGRSGPIDQAVIGYTHLLGVRRSLAHAYPDGKTILGTEAADKVKTMNEIMRKLGPRAMGLAKKGRKDNERAGVIYLNDELHCLLAIAHALIHRTDTVLLTADEDYIEIFFKAQWFIDTHYRAWLAAQLIKNGNYGQPAGEFTQTRGYFEEPLTLYRRPTGQLQVVLPPAKTPVRVGVVYVAPDGLIHKMVFRFDPQMVDMLATRGATDGRCTDLFGEANIHVDLGPLKPRMDGLYLGIGRDVAHTFRLNGLQCRLAELDLIHSVNCLERRAISWN